MTTKVNSTVLNNTDVTSGTYGGSSRIPFFTVDAQGRITSAANVVPSIATNQLTGKVQADQLANNATFGISITGNAGTADTASTIPVTGISGTHYLYTSANRPGTTRLYRRDDDSAYNIQTFYNGTTSRWALYGYNDNTAHAGVEVAYANTAGSAPASDVYSWAKATTKPSYSKSEVGLGNVDNTADANKSVNYANTSGNGGVTAVNAGTGISVSSTTGSVTVSNGGVTSLTAGSGISVTSSTGGVTVSATGGVSSSTITNLTSYTASSSVFSINFTDIPSWAKRIKIMFYGLGTTGSSPILIRTLSGGGTTALTSGYICNSICSGSGGSATTSSFTNGFGFVFGQASAYFLTGTTTLDRLNDNRWTCSGTVLTSASNLGSITDVITTAGGVVQVIPLSGIQITTVAAQQRFSAGSVNVSYE